MSRLIILHKLSLSINILLSFFLVQKHFTGVFYLLLVLTLISAVAAFLICFASPAVIIWKKQLEFTVIRADAMTCLSILTLSIYINVKVHRMCQRTEP